MNKWFETSQIGRIQIELTNYCNAACPQCDRYEQYVDWKNGRIKDQSTGQMVDFFLFCSKSNSTESSCKYNSSLEHRYMITLDKFQNTKVFKYNKNKNKWNKIDG